MEQTNNSDGMAENNSNKTKQKNNFSTGQDEEKKKVKLH